MAKNGLTGGPWECSLDDDYVHASAPIVIRFTNIDADDDGCAHDYGHEICTMADYPEAEADALWITATPEIRDAVFAVQDFLRAHFCRLGPDRWSDEDAREVYVRLGSVVPSSRVETVAK